MIWRVHPVSLPTKPFYWYTFWTNNSISNCFDNYQGWVAYLRLIIRLKPGELELFLHHLQYRWSKITLWKGGPHSKMCAYKDPQMSHQLIATIWSNVRKNIYFNFVLELYLLRREENHCNNVILIANSIPQITPIMQP